jgi:hypothetical protein
VAAARGGEGIERGLDGGGIWGPPPGGAWEEEGEEGEETAAMMWLQLNWVFYVLLRWALDALFVNSPNFVSSLIYRSLRY